MAALMLLDNMILNRNGVICEYKTDLILCTIYTTGCVWNSPYGRILTCYVILLRDARTVECYEASSLSVLSVLSMELFWGMFWNYSTNSVAVSLMNPS